MNFKHASRFLLLTAVAVFLFHAPVHAQEGGAQGSEAGTAGGVGTLKERLGLTPEQLQQIREIRSQHEPEARALGRRVVQARRVLDEAIHSDEADEALIEQRAKELAEAQGEATRLRARVEWRIRRVLTREQLNTLRVIRQQAQRDLLESRRRRRLRRTPGDALNEGTNDDATKPRRNPLRRLRRRGLLSRP